MSGKEIQVQTLTTTQEVTNTLTCDILIAGCVLSNARNERDGIKVRTRAVKRY